MRGNNNETLIKKNQGIVFCNFLLKFKIFFSLKLKNNLKYNQFLFKKFINLLIRVKIKKLTFL